MKNSEIEQSEEIELGKPLQRVATKRLEPGMFLHLITLSNSRYVYHVYIKNNDNIYIQHQQGPENDLEGSSGKMINKELEIGELLHYVDETKTESDFTTNQLEQIVVSYNPVPDPPEPIIYGRYLQKADILSFEKGNIIVLKDEYDIEYRLRIRRTSTKRIHFRVIGANNEYIKQKGSYRRPFIRIGNTFRCSRFETGTIKSIFILRGNEIEEEYESYDEVEPNKDGFVPEKFMMSGVTTLFSETEKETLEMLGLRPTTFTFDELQSAWIEFKNQYGQPEPGASLAANTRRKIIFRHGKIGYESLLKRFK